MEDGESNRRLYRDHAVSQDSQAVGAIGEGELHPSGQPISISTKRGFRTLPSTSPISSALPGSSGHGESRREVRSAIEEGRPPLRIRWTWRPRGGVPLKVSGMSRPPPPSFQSRNGIPAL